MEPIEIGKLVAFVLIVAVPLLFLEAAMRRSKRERERPGGRG
jgi:hypothetical protein